MESDKPPARTIFSPGSVLDVPAGRRLRPYPAGYCYLELFDVGDHDAARSLGPFPPVSALQAFVDSGHKCATDVLVRLTLRVQDDQVVAHIQQSDKANAVRASLVLQALNGETLVGSDVSERSSVASSTWWPGSLIGQVVQRHSASGGGNAPRGFCYLALFRESLWQEAMMLGPIPTVRTLQKFAREYADPWSVSDVNVTLHVEGERVLAHVVVDESDTGVPPMKVLDAIASYVRVGITLPRLRDNLASAWRSQYVGYLGSGRLDVGAVMSLNDLFRCIVELTEPGDPELGNGPSDPRMLAHRDLMVGTPTIDYAALPSGGISLAPAPPSTAGDTGFCYLALFSQQHRSKAQQLGPLPTVADLRRFANAHKEPYSTRNVALAVHSKDGEAVAHIIEMQGTGLTAACALASLDKGVRVGVGEISVVKESTAGDVAVGPPLQLEVTPINKNEHTITLPIGGYLNADMNGMSIDPRIVPGLKRTFSIFESVRLLKFEMNVTVQGDASTMCRVAATTNSEPPVGNGGWITSPASMIMTGSMTGSTVNQFILPEDHQFGRELKAAFISNPPPIFHFYVTSNVPCHVMFRGLFTLQMAGRGNPTGIDFSKGLKYQMKSRHPRSVIREGQVEDESDDDDEEEAAPPSRAGRAAPAGAAAKSTQHTR